MKPLRAATPAPPVDVADVINGLETFIADLKNGHAQAVDMAGRDGKTPMDGADWAAYPNDPNRLQQIKRARLTAAQAKADQVVRTIDGHGIESQHRLLVAVIDQATNTRLATTFVAYDPT